MMGKVVSVNPTTEEIFGELDESSDADILEKVFNAKKDNSWAGKSAVERARILSKISDLLENYKEELATTMAMEIGKPVKAGRHEVEIAKKRVKDFCSMIPSFLEDEVIFESEEEKNVVVFEPRGIVVVISPWNAPVFVPLASIIPPLLCGNNVIWKPSEHSTFTGLVLEKIFNDLKEDGFSENSFQCVVGGKDVGKRLVESDVDMIALTGSVRAGKEVGRICGNDLKKFVLELGGKDPAIILEDADIEKAAREIVKSSIMYTGQVCFGVERVYCHESVYNDFVELCVDETKNLKVGDPSDNEVDMGPFSVKFQMEKVLEHVNDALEKGARLLCGGRRMPRIGYFFSPGVLVDVNHSMKIMKEETFGPITCIMKFRDVDEAIKLANDSEYGLTASVWTSDLAFGEKIARRIEAGTVEINRHGMSKAGCPWGGYKKSGIGRIYSREGVREFCNVKHVWVVR